MALTNVNEFVVGLERFAGETEEKRKQVVRAAGMYALRGVVFSTRVNTGRARGNWQAAEGEPPVGYDPTVYHPEGDGIEGGTVRDPVAEESEVMLGASGNEVLWLHNGVPYIEVLEGWDGMVASTYEALRTWARSR